MGRADRREEESVATRPSLLARMRGGEDVSGWERGWREFFEVYHPVLYRYARGQGLSEEDAEDAVQEIVIGVARRLPEFRYEPERCSFKTWLFRVARNKVVDHRRRRGREERHRGIEDAHEASAEAEDTGALMPDAAWDLDFESNLRRTALERVGQRVRPMTMRLYLHHVVDGHDVASTVRQFRESGVTSAGVYLAKHRIRSLLKRELTRLRKGELEP